MTTQPTTSQDLRAPLSPSPKLPGYLSEHVGVAQVASTFQGVELLADSEPWFALPHEHTPFWVDIPQLGVKDAVLAVHTPQETQSGFSLFRRKESWEAWLDDDAPPLAQDGGSWEQLDLVLDAKDTLNDQQLQEIKEHGWDIYNAFGYPDWYAVTPDQERADPSSAELLILEAVVRAFSQALDGDRIAAWHRVWTGEDLVQLKFWTHCGDQHLEVFFRSQALPGTEDLWGALLDWHKDKSAKAHDRYQDLHAELLYRYRFTQEGYGRGMDRSYLEALLGAARVKMGCSIAQLTPRQLDTVLRLHLRSRFKSSWKGEKGQALEAFGSLYRYLHRSYGMKIRGHLACLREHMARGERMAA